MGCITLVDFLISAWGFMPGLHRAPLGIGMWSNTKLCLIMTIPVKVELLLCVAAKGHRARRGMRNIPRRAGRQPGLPAHVVAA